MIKVTAFVLIQTKQGKEREVLETLNTEKDLENAWLTYGDYDIIVRTEPNDLNSLNEFIIQRLRTFPGIIATNTLIGL